MLGLWLTAIFAPLIWAWLNRASIAMAMVLSLLFGYIIQMVWMWTGYANLHNYVAMFPILVEQGHIHTLITSGFVHSPFDPLHVLGNIMIVALVGIPLEERMGRERWLVSYLLGMLGGSIAWTLANQGSGVPVLGASGAAFGILGAYLAGWPKDEVLFPFILIRKWPVQFIALIYFGLEIFNAYQQYELAKVSHIAHLAHLGGFVVAYFTLKPLMRGRVWESELAELSELPDEHPFSGVDDLIERLRNEGDEKETRQAWMEEIAHRAKCPVCEGDLEYHRHRIRCASDKSHLSWP